MATAFDQLELKVEIPATPKQIFDAWLSSEGHTAMTGSDAVAGSKVGDAFTAWDGYISGVNVAIEPNERIVQKWRTSEFADTDEDSLLEVTLTPTPHGTLLNLVHTRIPKGQGESYEQGWFDYYFEPMAEYFSA